MMMFFFLFELEFSVMLPDPGRTGGYVLFSATLSHNKKIFNRCKPVIPIM